MDTVMDDEAVVDDSAEELRAPGVDSDDTSRRHAGTIRAPG
jgi:hypothetical protein